MEDQGEYQAGQQDGGGEAAGGATREQIERRTALRELERIINGTRHHERADVPDPSHLAWLEIIAPLEKIIGNQIKLHNAAMDAGDAAEGLRRWNVVRGLRMALEHIHVAPKKLLDAELVQAQAAAGTHTHTEQDNALFDHPIDGKQDALHARQTADIGETGRGSVAYSSARSGAANPVSQVRRQGVSVEQVGAGGSVSGVLWPRPVAD